MELTNTYKIEDCIHCNFEFALSEKFLKRRRNDHKVFYCPRCGKGMVCSELSDVARLKRQLTNVQACCVEYEEKAEALEKSKRAYKGHVTRLKKRIA